MLKLMLFDKEVLLFDRKSGATRILEPDLLPFGLSLSEDDDFDERVNNRSVFDHWCASRVLSLDRKYAKEILNYFGLKQAVTDSDRADIALTVRGLTLTDCYWIKEEKEVLSWNDVNLYNNHLNEALFEVALLGSPSVSNESLVTPELTTSGVYPKAWQRTSDGFILYKGNVDDSVRREVESCAILNELGFKTVQYTLDWWDNQTVSKCKCITDEQYSIASAENVFLSCMAKEEDFNTLIDKERAAYDIMNLADYLVGNTDRHQGNWGFGFNPVTRNIIGLHPLMDFNKAFYATKETICLPEHLCNNKKITQEDIAFSVLCSYPELKNHFLHFLDTVDFSKYHYGGYVKDRLLCLVKRYSAAFGNEGMQEHEERER